MTRFFLYRYGRLPTVDEEQPAATASAEKSSASESSSTFLLIQRIQHLYRERVWLLSLLIAALIVNALLWLNISRQQPLFSEFLDDSNKPPRKRNVIFMVSDGFGPASETYARSFHQFLQNGPENGLPPYDGTNYDKMLPLDTILVGQSRTRSADSFVTDSAAGATAFSCALKSYNGAVGVNTTMTPCATVMEAAKYHGMKTGIVVTSRITHATPAAFSSHSTWRNYEAEIAVQQIGDNPLGSIVDVMFGGGRCFFLPRGNPQSCRKDARNLEQEARKRFGFSQVLTSREEFDKLSKKRTKLPLMGLFAPDHMSYSIDRDPLVEPSLKEMTEKALELLTESTKNSDKGFMLLVEGSRIDMAAHDNDAAAHAHEILAYQETIALVKRYIDENPGTVMISVADHETGGFTLGRQVTAAYPQYTWNPEVVHRVQNSTDAIAAQISTAPKDQRTNYVRNVILPMFIGIEDFDEKDVHYLSDAARTKKELIWYLGDMISRRALLGWSTHGHTGVDVNLYAYAGEKHAQLVDPLRRNLENIELGTFMKEYLQFEDGSLDELTNLLIKGVEDGTLIMFPRGKPPKPRSDEGGLVGEKDEEEEAIEVASYHGTDVIPEH